MPPPSKIPTRAQILKRIKLGPVQFSVLAVSRRHNNPARIAARKICDKLEADGLIVMVYIGKYRYYIENTQEAKKQAIRQQIEECSRFDPATGCTVWTGYVDEIRGPMMRQSLASSNGTVNVRRWLFTELIGRELKGVEESVKMKARCDADCIDPAHMVKKTRSQLLKGIPKSITAKIALQKAVRERWGKRQDAVEIIRSSDKSNAELAAELSMSKSNVWSIRAGRTFRLQQTPFAGLTGAQA